MEKFGIFELLDALSAITSAAKSETDLPAADRTEGAGNAEGQKNAMAGADDGAAAKRTPDAAFAPPTYGAASAPGEGGNSPAAAPAGRTAYDGFLARHEAAKGRVKKG